MTELPRIEPLVLRDLFRFNASLGLYRFLKGVDYVRTIELPVFAAEVLECRESELAYLDVGSGDSILPAYVAARSRFRVTAIDKFEWVQAQRSYLERMGKGGWIREGRFQVLEEDFLSTTALPQSAFDVVTAVSVLEHIDGQGDSEAVAKVYGLLRPGGRFILSCPYNHDRPADYHVPGSVYGEAPTGDGAFFQRHYGAETLRSKILEAAPFVVESIFYAGHYGRFNFAKAFYFLPMPLKLAKALYNWATPFYAPRFMSLSLEPPSDSRPRMVTADTVFVFLRKPT